MMKPPMLQKERRAGGGEWVCGERECRHQRGRGKGVMTTSMVYMYTRNKQSDCAKIGMLMLSEHMIQMLFICSTPWRDTLLRTVFVEL